MHQTCQTLAKQSGLPTPPPSTICSQKVPALKSKGGGGGRWERLPGPSLPNYRQANGLPHLTGKIQLRVGRGGVGVRPGPEIAPREGDGRKIGVRRESGRPIILLRGRLDEDDEDDTPKESFQPSRGSGSLCACQKLCPPPLPSPPPAGHAHPGGCMCVRARTFAVQA